MDREEVIDHIFAHQAAVIRKQFGEGRSANYGWGIEDMEEGAVVHTKIYGKDPQVLVTSSKDGIIFHDDIQPY